MNNAQTQAFIHTCDMNRRKMKGKQLAGHCLSQHLHESSFLEGEVSWQQDRSTLKQEYFAN